MTSGLVATDSDVAGTGTPALAASAAHSEESGIHTFGCAAPPAFQVDTKSAESTAVTVTADPGVAFSAATPAIASAMSGDAATVSAHPEEPADPGTPSAEFTPAAPGPGPSAGRLAASSAPEPDRTITVITPATATIATTTPIANPTRFAVEGRR